MTNRTVVLEKLDEAISAIKREQNEPTSDMSRTHLRKIEDELRHLRGLVEANMEDDESAALGIGRAIGDLWPLNNPVGEIVLNACQTYQRFVRAERKHGRM